MGAFAVGRHWGFRLFVGVLVGVLVRSTFSFDTNASHWATPHRHLASMLHPSESEDFCVRVEDASFPLDAADDLIYNTLNSEAAPGVDWEGTRWLHFVNNGTCPPIINLGTGLEMIFTIKPDIPGGFAGNEQAVAEKPDSDSGHPGFPEYYQSYINLEATSLGDLNSAYQLINHESGHAFNLCDGGPSFGGDDQCQVLAFCGGVMHVYGCPLPWAFWPSAFEHASVESLVPGGGNGGGGPIGEGKMP